LLRTRIPFTPEVGQKDLDHNALRKSAFRLRHKITSPGNDTDLHPISSSLAWQLHTASPISRYFVYDYTCVQRMHCAICECLRLGPRLTLSIILSIGPLPTASPSAAMRLQYAPRKRACQLLDSWDIESTKGMIAECASLSTSNWSITTGPVLSRSYHAPLDHSRSATGCRTYKPFTFT